MSLATPAPPSRRVRPPTVRPDAPPRSALPPLATRAVLLVSAATVLVAVIASVSVGYFADELYFLAAGNHLDWGYVDQQPLVPLLARVMDTVFPGSAWALRAPSIAVTALGVLLAALLARELGGDRRAQTLSAVTYALCPLFFVSSHTLVTATFDAFLWMVVTWLLVRWVRLHQQRQADDRLLLSAGLATAVAIQVKFLILGFWAAAGLAFVLIGPRAVLRRPLLWAGAAVAVTTAIPTLLWQAQHDWPQLAMGSVVDFETSRDGTPLLPGALLIAGPLGAPLMCYGLFRLFRSPRLRPYRFLGLTMFGVLALFLTMGGRPYYVAGMFPALWAVGAVELPWPRERAGKGVPAWPVWTAGIASALLAATLLVVHTSLISGPQRDWSSITRQTVKAVHSLPPAQQRNTAVLTQNYWDASALSQFGPDQGLAHVYSGNRGYWFFGRPPDTVRRVVQLGGSRSWLHRHFDHVHLLGTVRGYTTGPRPLWLAEDPRTPWPRLWPDFRSMNTAV